MLDKKYEMIAFKQFCKSKKNFFEIKFEKQEKVIGQWITIMNAIFEYDL